MHYLILAPERVPRSVVVSRGTSIGGQGHSWSVPTFILGGNFPGGMPGDEDPIPVDGNPHPAHGVPLAGNPNNFQNWQHDLVGAGNQALGDAGINIQMMQEINMEVDPMVQFQNVQNQGNGNNVQMEDLMDNWVPQHPDQPQDTITFDQSGSTANYLRANGPDIVLRVEDVLAKIQNEVDMQNAQNG